jgi:tripartite-type tricarboxylate transporter receptor subunit TctC
MPEIDQRLTDMVIGVAPTSRDEFAQFIHAEIARWAQVIEAAGIAKQ